MGIYITRGLPINPHKWGFYCHMLKFQMLNETENKQKNLYKSKKPPALREGPN